MTQVPAYTQEQLMALAQQWQQQSGFNLEQAAKNAKPQNEYWGPSNGITILRILPPGPNQCQLFRDGWWTAKYFKYWVNLPKIGAAAASQNDKKEENNIVYDGKRSCPAKFADDPIASALDEACATVSSDILKGMRSKARCLVNVWIREIYDDRGNPSEQDMQQKLVIADMPITFHDWVRAKRANPSIMGDFLNPFKGRDIMITRTGSGKTGTKYEFGLHPSKPEGPIFDDLQRVATMLEAVPDLVSVIEANCTRDVDRAKEMAAKIREWARAVGSVNPFGPGSAPQQQQGGFVPGLFPGTMPQAQGFPQMAPQMPALPPVFPTMPPPLAPQFPNSGMPPQFPQFPQQPPQGQPIPWPQQQPPVPQPIPQPPVQQFQQPQTQTQFPQQQQASATAVSQPVLPTPPPQAGPSQQPQAVSRPPCYKEFGKRNGTAPGALENPTDPQCKPCAYKVPCSFESTMV